VHGMKDNPYIYPVIFCGMLEIIAFIGCKLLFPTEDITVIMGVITLGIGQVITFLINASQAELANQRAQIATQRAENANDRADAARDQVQDVSRQVAEVNVKASESQVTSRTGLSAMVKGEELARLDELADGFSKTTLTYDQTQEFVRLLEHRLQDDLTIQQLTAAQRILEIMRKEMKTPEIHDKPLVTQSPEDHAVSKQIQKQAEHEQRAAGTRKSDSQEETESSLILTMPSVVAAAKAAVASAEKTKAATQETVVVAAREIEKEREEKKSEGKE